MRARKISKDFTQGSIPKQLLLFMLPFMASNAGQVLVSQALGGGKRQEINRIVGTLFTIILAMGFFFAGVILRIRLSWLLGIGLGLGFYGFVLGYGLAPCGCAVPGLIYFLMGKWQKRKTLAEEM